MSQPPVYSPKVELFLIKNVARVRLDEGVTVASRFQQISTSLVGIDLSRFLHEGGGIRISKAVNEPAGGFSITLSDRPHESLMDSLYGLIEPMDGLLICMAHDPSLYPNKRGLSRLPIIMRGLVSEVSRNESIGGDGRPSRSVVVTGQDYGKVLEILQIIYLNNSVVGDNILHEFKPLQKYGIDYAKNPTLSDFVTDVCDRVISRWIQMMEGTEEDTTQRRIIPDVSATGRVSYPLINAWPGGQGIYHLLAHACDVDSGFNEMFIEDRPDAIYLVLRPKPWRNVSGEYIQPGTPAIKTIAVSEDDLLSMNVSRSDQGVANLFWVQAPQMALIFDEYLRLDAQVAPITDPNCSPELYGIRQMETTTNIVGFNFSDGDSAGKLAQDRPAAIAWMRQRRDMLAAASKDAVVFEHGSMKLKGNENIRAGMFLRLDRGIMSSHYYVTRVDHDFVPFHSFTTTVHFERGTGFITRAKQRRPYENESVR